MTSQILHVNLSYEAAGRLDGIRNANGQTLRDWVLNALHRSVEPCLTRASLFSTSLEVEPDVPVLIGAYAQVVSCTPEQIVEAWLMDPAIEAEAQAASVFVSCSSKHLTDETLGNIAQALDMGEILLEVFAADMRRKLGSYAEGDKAAQTMSEIFRALRLYVGLAASDTND